MILKKISMQRIEYSSDNRKLLIKTFTKNCDKNLGPMSDYVKKLAEFQKIKGKGKIYKNLRRKNDFLLRDFLTALVICHNVTPSYTDGKVSYQASSPDEIAFVKFCESINLKLLKRDQKTILIQLPNKVKETYDILAIFPFKSSTKRMGIVVRH